MAKFKPVKPDEKEVISLRIQSETLRMIDQKANEADISRNEIINQMILFALSNMDESSSD